MRVPSPSLRSRLRGRLRRRPLAYWMVAATAATVAGILTANVVRSATAERDRLGSLRPVLVATRSLPVGHRLQTDDTERRRLPAAALPDGALDSTGTGAVLAVPVGRGEVLTGMKLAPAGLGPVAGLLPAGTRGLAVPDGASGLRLAPGDVVDVLATFPPETAGGGDPTFAVATDAVIVDVTDEDGWVTVAVPERDAPRVAFALAQGLVTLALSGDR